MPFSVHASYNQVPRIGDIASMPVGDAENVHRMTRTDAQFRDLDQKVARRRSNTAVRLLTT